MVFSSFVFLFAFLPLCLVGYFASPARMKNGILLLFSLIFYAWGEPIWIIVLLFNVWVAWIGGRFIERSTGARARFWLFLSVGCQISFLAYFKYLGFILQSFSDLFGISLSYSHPGLPIGISFFTFHLISYLVDIHRKEASTLKSYSTLLLYISMFPQLVAGPIIRFADVQHQLQKRSITLQNFSSGIARFAVGLGKKVILANSLSELTSLLMNGDLRSQSVLGAWVGILAFALQIYFDFSGYSDMAIGLGRMFGFHFRENFDYPYVSKSATEFWRRWNISVGRFFRDYVYIPMGGNRRNPRLNLFVVWSLTGLWHGASWNYVLWGLYFGVLIALEKLVLMRQLSRLPGWVSRFYFGVIVLMGWVLFYFESLDRGWRYLRVMWGADPVPLWNTETSIFIQNHMFLILVAACCATPLPARLHRRMVGSAPQQRFSQQVYAHTVVPIASTVLLVLSAIMLVGKSYAPFFYFRF